mgnify:FL=1
MSMLEGKKNIAVFDFDGTITNKDTLLYFILFTKGYWAFMVGFLLYSPLLIAFKLRLYPNWKVKQALFSYFFGGMDYKEFQRWGEIFADEVEKIERESTVDKLKNHLKNGDKVYVISASIDDWVRPFCCSLLGVTATIGTKVEVDPGGKLTGRFLTKNCYGPEKVNRLLEIEPDRRKYFLYAYGDSRGDKEILEFADRGIMIR